MLIDQATWERTMLAGVAAKVATYSRILVEQGVEASLLPILVAGYQDNELNHERKLRLQEARDEAYMEVLGMMARANVAEVEQMITKAVR